MDPPDATPPLDLRDALALVGLALAAAGAGMVYLPAAFILVGLVLMLVGVFGLPRPR